MTRFGVQIEKSCSFRGGVQPFSNTYYYEASVAEDNIPYLNDLLDVLIPIERTNHAPTVNFVSARVWSQIGTKAQNQMLIERSLTGVGTGPAENTATDRERAFLIQFRAGVDTRGRPVYLRKWFHLFVGTLGANSLTNDMLKQTAQLLPVQRDALVAIGNDIKTLTPGAGPNAELVSKNGRQITGSTSAHPWYEHHQLGDAWRGQ